MTEEQILRVLKYLNPPAISWSNDEYMTHRDGVYYFGDSAGWEFARKQVTDRKFDNADLMCKIDFNSKTIEMSYVTRWTGSGQIKDQAIVVATWEDLSEILSSSLRYAVARRVKHELEEGYKKLLEAHVADRVQDIIQGRHEAR